jgi:hypothetical protein
VLNDLNQPVSVDIICHDVIGKGDCFLYFVDEIVSLGSKAYKLSESQLSRRIIPEDISQKKIINIRDKVILTIDENMKDFGYKLCKEINNHDLRALLNDPKCIEDNFNLDYEYYESNTDRRRGEFSGAYIFNPASSKRTYSRVQFGKIYRGRHLTLVQVSFSAFVS